MEGVLGNDFGGSLSSIDWIEQFRQLVRKYEEQSGESVTDNVQAGIKEASIRDHLALHAGRLNSFDEMDTEVSTVARNRNDNDNAPMDVSGKDGKGKTKGKDGKDKSESKSSSLNKDKNCFHCDKIGHVKADRRKKKKDDEERKTTLAQYSLTSSSDATSPPGLTNVPASTSVSRLG